MYRGKVSFLGKGGGRKWIGGGRGVSVLPSASWFLQTACDLADKTETYIIKKMEMTVKTAKRI